MNPTLILPVSISAEFVPLSADYVPSCVIYVPTRVNTVPLSVIYVPLSVNYVPSGVLKIFDFAFQCGSKCSNLTKSNYLHLVSCVQW